MLGTGLMSEIVKCATVICVAALTLRSYVRISRYAALVYKLGTITNFETPAGLSTHRYSMNRMTFVPATSAHVARGLVKNSANMKL